MNESNVAAVRVSVYPDWVLPMTGMRNGVLKVVSTVLTTALTASLYSFLGHFNSGPVLQS